jgi:hypothetical protein
MSARLLALLLRLYPRAIRERYGDELLELSRELQARGDRGRVASVGDLLAGAWRVRLRRPARWVVIAAFTTIAVAVGVGIAVAASPGAGGPASAGSPRGDHHRVVRMAAVPSITVPCFVASGGTCASMPCTEFIAASDETVPVPVAPARVTPRRPTGRAGRAAPTGSPTRCTADPRVQPRSTVFVGG